MRAGFKSQSIVALLLGLTACHSRPQPDQLTVVTQIQRLRDLATVRFSLQRVVGLREQKIPFGEESILLMVQGEVTAGVNMAALTRDSVRFTDPDAATVELPAAAIQNVSLDEKQTKVWDRQVTWWTPWVPYSPDLEHRARLQAIDDVRKAALQMGILNQADRNAAVAIQDLLQAFGIKVQVRKLAS